ncbi:MAG: glycosyltransferase family 4 protein [Verrucomicrobiaceae bacterium]|nr:glycosyltransferase family 4 protein [Verrucomicrobiaceae bacterium]
MKILFLNQFVPPDPAPTARLLGEVAAELERRGHEVVLVGDGADYRGSKTLFGSRALREAVSLLRLLGRAVRVRRVDVIVSLTSPPLVAVVARWARLRHGGARLVHWAMDLYPEVAVALGEVRAGSLLHRLTASLMGGVYRACDCVVALDEDMAARIAAYGTESEVQAPWPPLVEGIDGSRPPQDQNDGETFTWLYSGNLGRAHEWRTLLDAQALLEEEGAPVDLVFQGGGSEGEAARDYAADCGLRRCRWRDYASSDRLLDSLLGADCLIVTQRPETRGCLWPSKLALLLLLDLPLVWVGDKESAPAKAVTDGGHFCAAPGEAAQLARHLRSLAEAKGAGASPPPAGPGEIAGRVRQVRESGVRQLADWIVRSRAL